MEGAVIGYDIVSRTGKHLAGIIPLLYYLSLVSHLYSVIRYYSPRKISLLHSRIHRLTASSVNTPSFPPVYENIVR